MGDDGKVRGVLESVVGRLFVIVSSKIAFHCEWRRYDRVSLDFPTLIDITSPYKIRSRVDLKVKMVASKHSTIDSCDLN